MTENREYWIFQVVTWSVFTLLSYLSLTVWYNPGEWYPAVHTVLQSCIGLFISHPTRLAALWTWNAPLARRVPVNVAAVLAAALLWTIVRLTTFSALTGEAIGPEDWGGWYFASAIVFGCWSLAFHAVRYNRLLQDQRVVAAEAEALAQQETLKRLEAENLTHQAQLRMLRSQLSPHFLFNALNSVSALVQEGRREEATTMLARIGEFLRASLEEDGDLTHALDAEISLVQLYLGIEKVRFSDRLHADFDVEEAARNVEVPSLLLQPLFENCIKFAVGRSLAPTRIALRAWVEDGRLEIRLSDDGPGLSSDPGGGDAHASTGVGLRNVRQRLGSVFGEDVRFALTPVAPHGLCVEISIPAASDARPGPAAPPPAVTESAR